MQIKIPESVSPQGLRCRAEIVRAQNDESCARHLELAADKIEQLEGALDAARSAFLRIERNSEETRAFVTRMING